MVSKSTPNVRCLALYTTCREIFRAFETLVNLFETNCCEDSVSYSLSFRGISKQISFILGIPAETTLESPQGVTVFLTHCDHFKQHKFYKTKIFKTIS